MSRYPLFSIGLNTPSSISLMIVGKVDDPLHFTCSESPTTYKYLSDSCILDLLLANIAIRDGTIDAPGHRSQRLALASGSMSPVPAQRVEGRPDVFSGANRVATAQTPDLE